MEGCYTDCIRNNVLLAALFVALAVLPLHAVDAGRAEGTIIIGGTAINLTNAYAIGGQKDDANGRNDDVKIILTDQPLPDGFDLKTVETAMPESITGIVFAVDHDRQPSHVWVQYANGTYDGGYFTKSDVFRFRGKTTEGRVTARRFQTGTTTISFDVQFAAAVQ